MAGSFQYPHEIDAVIDALGLDLDPVMKRRVSDVIAMLAENDLAVAQAMGGGFGSVPTLDADPAQPVDGMVWINTTDDAFRVRHGGVTHDLT